MVRRVRRRSVGGDTGAVEVDADPVPRSRQRRPNQRRRRTKTRPPPESPKGSRSQVPRERARVRRRSVAGVAAAGRLHSPAPPKTPQGPKEPTSPSRPTRARRVPTRTSPPLRRHGDEPDVRVRLGRRRAGRPGRRRTQRPTQRPTRPFRPRPLRSRPGPRGAEADARRSSRPTPSWPDPLAFVEGDRPSGEGAGSPPSPRPGSPTS